MQFKTLQHFANIKGGNLEIDYILKFSLDGPIVLAIGT